MAPPSTRPMFAMLCANNVNRSTEAHDHLNAAGLRVCSFGAGNKVRFPGPSRYDPRIYEFFTPYQVMYDELKSENADLYVVDKDVRYVLYTGFLLMDTRVYTCSGSGGMACCRCSSATFSRRRVRSGGRT